MASAADPEAGLAANELGEAVARCGIAKYRGVPSLSPGQAVAGFIQNLLGEKNEEQVLENLA